MTEVSAHTSSVPFRAGSPVFHRLEKALSWRVLIFLWVLLFQGLILAYFPAFPSPFIYDDLPNIVYNEDFRSDTPLTDILRPHPSSMQFDKRPVGGVLSWLNFRIAGLNAGAFRGVNLLIHWLAAGAAGLVTALAARRTGLTFPRLFAVVVAAIWALHPIHSTAVIYISQRMESLMTLFFLLSCACLLRGMESPGRKGPWRFLCGMSALLCLLSKENGAGLPLVLLLMDRVLGFGSWREVWRRHRIFYIVLAMVWGGALVWIALGARLSEVDRIPALSSPWAYFKTECHVVRHYFQLLLWPSPLVFAPVPRVAQTLNDWLPAAMLLVAGFGAVALMARRWPWIWIPWLTVLIVLAPTSSFIPVPLEPAFDYRMHLPALGALVLAAAALRRLATASRRAEITSGFGLAAVLALSVAATRQRARDYARPESIWLDTVTKEPENVKAWVNLAAGLHQTGHPVQAREALMMLDSLNLSFRLPWVTGESARISAMMAESEGKWREAEAEWDKAVAAVPEQADFRVGKARTAFHQNRPEDALRILEELPAGSSAAPEAALWRAHALHALGRQAEALQAALPAGHVRMPDHQLSEALESWRKLANPESGTAAASGRLGK